MKILIIGADGFIGGHCANYFSKKFNNVFLAGTKKDGILNKNYYLLTHENTDFNLLFQHNEYDICINASGYANVSLSFENPAKDFELNVVNVHKILLAIRRYNPKCRLINFSSAAVYGNPIKLPITENSKLLPLSPYGFHKLQSESLLTEYHKFFGIHTCSLRVFSAYGVGLKKQIFWDLYQKINQKIKNNIDIEIFGTGEESRDFIFIDDLIFAIDLIIQKANFEGECINVSSGIETKIKDVVSIFYENWDKNIAFNFSGKIKIGDPNNWKADIKQLEQMGFISQVSIYEGINKYIKWLKEQE